MGDVKFEVLLEIHFTGCEEVKPEDKNLSLSEAWLKPWRDMSELGSADKFRPEVEEEIT